MDEEIDSYEEYGQRRMEEHLRSGVLYLEDTSLTANDVKRILQKAASSRKRRPRKCQRVDGAINKFLSKLPSPVPIIAMIYYLNEAIGDVGMAHLHLVPETVTTLNFARCGLTAAGARILCDFLKTNTTITAMIMWGNEIGDEGAKHIAEMLRVNKPIEDLNITQCHFSPRGFAYISDALADNDTLRKVWFHNDESIGDEHVRNLFQGGLTVNHGVETVDLRQSVALTGLGYIEECLQSNYYLKAVEPLVPVRVNEHPTPNSPGVVETIKYLLTLNTLNRKIVEDEDATLSDWLNCLIKSSKYERVDFSFFFLRNKPELCMDIMQRPGTAMA